jgi:photosystem II cytochrome c550
MSKKNIYFNFKIVILTIIYVIINNANLVYASDLDEKSRTVLLDANGKTVTLTTEQVKKGKRLFNSNCAQCHGGGGTKTNPNIGLDIKSLQSATPRRDNIESLIDYMKNPTTYDGTESIAEIHPSIKSADIFPKMRNMTDDDLFTIAGHILLQSNIASQKWGGGKIYY